MDPVNLLAWFSKIGLLFIAPLIYKKNSLIVNSWFSNGESWVNVHRVSDLFLLIKHLCASARGKRERRVMVNYDKASIQDRPPPLFSYALPERPQSYQWTQKQRNETLTNESVPVQPGAFTPFTGSLNTVSLSLWIGGLGGECVSLLNLPHLSSRIAAVCIVTGVLLYLLVSLLVSPLVIRWCGSPGHCRPAAYLSAATSIALSFFTLWFCVYDPYNTPTTCPRTKPLLMYQTYTAHT